MKKYVVAVLICCFGLGIEALLLVRIWAQASAQSLDAGGMEALFSVTDDLASLLSPLTGREPLHTTGVIDYAVLFAAEVYLVATLSLLGITVAAIQGWAIFGKLRPKELPDFVKQQMASQRPRPHWQPVRTSGGLGAYYYVPVRRRATPEQTKSSLGG